jgi:tetratricopeptide (TPR) repeat protein
MGRLGIGIRTLLFGAALAASGAAHEDLLVQIDRISRQIEQEPGRAVLYFRRGELRRMHEDWAAAREDLERAATLDPALAAADLALGRLGNQSGDPRRAKASLDRFLAREPDHGEALIERARARVLLGEGSSAVEDFTRGLRCLEAPRPEHYIERADVLRSQGRLDEALKGLEEGLGRIGAALSLQLALIDLELETSKIDAALARLEEVARSSDRKDLWLARRGDILRQAGRKAEARSAFTAALASIEALPAARRKTRFTKDLELKVLAGLEATNEKP